MLNANNRPVVKKEPRDERQGVSHSCWMVPSQIHQWRSIF